MIELLIAFIIIGLFILIVIDPFKWIAAIEKDIERRSIAAAELEAARRKHLAEREAARRKYLLDNPHINTNDWEIHKQRMIKHDTSQFQWTHYYVGPRGGWYYINSNGRRTYC